MRGWIAAQLGIAAGCFGFAGNDAALRLEVQSSELRLHTAKAADRGGPLLRLERSTDARNWVPIARDYGESWHGVFPVAPTLHSGADGHEHREPMPAGAVFFRMLSESAPAPDNRAQAARFLQQASFGPTLQTIDEFPGVDGSTALNLPPYVPFADWIRMQIALPATSLRAYWRQRTHADFVDNTVFSANEVGFNAAIGFTLPYRVRSDTVRPDEAAATAIGRAANDVDFPVAEVKQLVWYQVALAAPDQLRQRVAWALAQLFVVSENGLGDINATEAFLHYYDIFVRHAFGNFRDILGEVTWSPLMAEYLTYLDNRKADTVKGTYPDENYAREVMQLFTIGLWQLEIDGTYRLDAAGQAIPTYDNDDIEQLAKVFTGMRLRPNRSNIEARPNNRIDPLRIDVGFKDYTAKTLLDGSRIGPFPQTIAGATSEINTVLDHLFDHPNTAPFVARFLIQRLVSSNPSPTYIGSVAQAFTTGQYAGFGAARRGDLSATVAAILLHPEARSNSLLVDPQHGALREPLVRFLHFCRALRITSTQTHGFIPFNNLHQQFNQSPFNSPSVFNFYLPDFQPGGEFTEQGLYAPEFQIHTDVSAISLPNSIRMLVRDGLKRPVGFRNYSQAYLDTADEVALADVPADLVDHLNLLLTAGRLTEANRALLVSALMQGPAATLAQRRERVGVALSLFALLPEFNVQQ